MAGRKTVSIKYSIEPGRSLESASLSSAYVITNLPGLRLNMRSRNWRPPTDLFETTDEIIVRVEIAGMSEGEFTITYFQGSLTIQGNRPDDQLGKRAYYQLEIPFGEFLTEIEIPVSIEPEQIEASYVDGFLWVVLPKVKPKSIMVDTPKD